MFSFGLLGVLWSWLCRGGSRGFGGVWSIHWRVRIDVWGGGVTLLVSPRDLCGEGRGPAVRGCEFTFRTGCGGVGPIGSCPYLWCGRRAAGHGATNWVVP